ncbi:MAG: GSCFA domain-containing protein, partial [Muribaculaceae bacterium]|nr:GSCFA domain-containing protein [Muribaculaceae bacterium]
MKLRTEIGAVRGSFSIPWGSPVLLLGSCFSDEIGSRLAADGFDVVANPLG